MEKAELNKMPLDELLSIRARVEEVIEERHRARRREAIDKIKRIAEEAGISLDELVKKSGRPTVVRFRDPANSANTWSGRGRRPGWLQAALERGGDLAEFAV